MLAGCNKPPYNTAPVTGVVRINGQPLGSGNIMFAPDVRGDGVNSGKPAFGTLDSAGHFALSTYADADGAVVGEHTVTISRALPKRAIVAETKVPTDAPPFRSIIVPS